MKMTHWMTITIFGAWIGVSAMAAAQTSAPVKDDLFTGTEVFAKGASDVTEVTMDPDTLGMVDGEHGRRAHSMVLNVVRTYTYDKPGMDNVADVDAFRNKLNTGDWHCSVHTRSLKTGESTDVCNKRRTDNLVETAIITVEPKSLTFIHTIRKRSAYETGDGTGALLMPGLAGLSTLAMISPMDQIHLNLKLDELNHLDFNDMQQKIQDGMKNMKGFDDKELQKQMDKMQKDIKQWQDSEESDKPKDKQPE